MLTAEQKIVNVLQPHLSEIMCKSILSLSLAKTRIDIDNLHTADRERLINEMSKGIRLYVQNPQSHNACIANLNQALTAGNLAAPVTRPQRSVTISSDSDIIEIRKVMRNASKEIGFSDTDQLRMSTSVTEVARTMLKYTQNGEIILHSLAGENSGIEIIARGQAYAKEDDASFGEDDHRSQSQSDWEHLGSRRLVDEFNVEVKPNRGFEITLRKYSHYNV